MGQFIGCRKASIYLLKKKNSEALLNISRIDLTARHEFSNEWIFEAYKIYYALGYGDKALLCIEILQLFYAPSPDLLCFKAEIYLLHMSSDSIQLAITFFNKALELDIGHEKALVGLKMANALLSSIQKNT
jgi:hypothetical protein